MKLHAIRDFLAVAERGSMRAAARALGLAQPALTRSIRELEKELGVDLLERHARGAALTPAGEAFLVRCRVVSNELRHAKEELDQMRGVQRGSVRVCMSSVAHMLLLPGSMRMFRQRYPEVDLHILDGLLPSIEKPLKEGAIDCYVGPIFDGIDPALSAEKLFDNRRVIVARQHHPLAHARSLRELAGAEWISTPIVDRAEHALVPLFARHGLPPPKFVMHAQSALPFLFAVAYSDLLMLLPIQWTQVPMFRGSLQSIEVEEALPAPPLGIVRLSGLPLTPAAEYFCDMVRRVSLHVDTGEAGMSGGV